MVDNELITKVRTRNVKSILSNVFTSSGSSFTLSNGNGTTANGSAVDLGGTQSAEVNIKSNGYNFYIGGDGSDFSEYADNVGISGKTQVRMGVQDATFSTNYSFFSSSFLEASGMTAGDGSTEDYISVGKKLYSPFTKGFFYWNYATGVGPSEADLIFGVSANREFTFNLGSDATGDIYYRNSSGYLTRLGVGTNGHVLTLAGGIPSWAAPSGGGWALTGTSTLTGAVDIVGSSSNTIKHTFASLGTTQTDGAGLHFRNTTAAAAGAQQISPSIVLEGQGWKTNATAASQSVKYVMDVLPVQGAANPTATFRLGYSINGAALTYPVTFDQSNSYFSVPNIVATSGTIQLNSSRILLFNGGLGSIRTDANSGLEFRANSTSTVITGGQYRFYNINNYTATSGTQTIIANETSFAPTSGTAVFNAYLGSGTINQTGGANGDVSMFALTPTYTAVGGDVYGFRYAPTVTSVTGVHYSFRSSSGNFLMGSTGKSANTGENVIVLNNATTNATAAQTNGIVIHSKDSSDGSANATLALYTEQAPEATATFTQTHRIKVWWNNAEYWLSLDAV